MSALHLCRSRVDDDSYLALCNVQFYLAMRNRTVEPCLSELVKCIFFNNYLLTVCIKVCSYGDFTTPDLRRLSV